MNVFAYQVAIVRRRREYDHVPEDCALVEQSLDGTFLADDRVDAVEQVVAYARQHFEVIRQQKDNDYVRLGAIKVWERRILRLDKSTGMPGRWDGVTFFEWKADYPGGLDENVRWFKEKA